MTRATVARRARALPRRQAGLVLFISLIVLVAMTLAGIAIMRSVDTGNLVSGNVAFKQGTINSADRGIDAAFTWLSGTINNSGTKPLLDSDVPSEGYFAVVTDPPASSPGLPPDWTLDSAWADAKTVGTDAAGNTIQYVIHRMCDAPGNYAGVPCAQTPRYGGAAGNSQGIGGNQFNSTPVVYYRTTVRVRGPRETLSIVQSIIGLQH